MNTVWSDTGTLFWREVLRYRRDRAYWIGQIAFPLVFVAFMGLGLDDVVTLPTGAGYAGHLASGILALVVGSGAVGAGFTLIEDRETGFLRALSIAPVSRVSIVLGKLTARILASVVLVGLLVALLSLFTSLRLVHPLALLGAVLGVTSVFVALGVTLASRLRRLESFRLIAAFATVPLYLFSGIFTPISTLPAPIQWLTYANPLTYGVDLIRYALLGVWEIPVALSGGMLMVLACGALWLAVAAFERSTQP